MKKNIAVLPGDGIGPEVMQQAIRVLESTGKLFGHDFVTTYGHVGGEAYEELAATCRKKRSSCVAKAMPFCLDPPVVL